MQQQRHGFDISLRELKLKLLQMGGTIQNAITQAVASLQSLDVAQAEQVVEKDKEVNQLEYEIEELCVRLIARQQPVASDLRKILAAMRIANDLERMGDNAVDIAKATIRLQGQTLIKPLIDIPQMASIIDGMISDTLNAYIEHNIELAKKAARDDDQVDGLYKKILNELFALAASQPEVITQAMTLSFVGRHLERIGDHATNISESIIYIITGDRSELN